MVQAAFEPTDEQRKFVETTSGLGITQNDICHLVINPETGEGISKRTLNKYFRAELNTGGAKAKTMIAQKLFTHMENGNVTTAIFLAKVRLGWVERQEHTGKDGGPIQHQDMTEDAAKAAIKALKGKTGQQGGEDATPDE